MKTFKTFLAWLDWSTYANDNYSFPKSLCGLFWRSLFSILLMPCIWHSHIWNLLFCTKENFKSEWAPHNKMYAPIGLMIHAISFVLGIFSWKLTDQLWMLDVFHITDGFL